MYVIIWKFTVKSGLEIEFESAYGPEGVWAECFRRADGYLATELLRDAAGHGHYLTIDRWDSKASYEKFRTGFAADYKKVDHQCEALTESESEVGTYERRPSISPGGNV